MEEGAGKQPHSDQRTGEYKSPRASAPQCDSLCKPFKKTVHCHDPSQLACHAPSSEAAPAAAGRHQPWSSDTPHFGMSFASGSGVRPIPVDVTDTGAEGETMLGTILLIILILLLLGALPTWPHSRNWGYYPG